MRVEQTVAALAALGTVGVVALTPAERNVEPPEGVWLWRAPEPEPQKKRHEAAASIAWMRDPKGHPSDRWWTPRAAAVVTDAVRELNPDVVVLEHLWTRLALDVVRQRARAVVLDAHNVEARLHEELVDLPGGQDVPRGLAKRLAQRTADIEAATVNAVDQVWAPSDEDVLELRLRYSPSAPLRAIPNGVEVDAVPPHRDRMDRPGLLFPGSFGYPPNAAAAVWLVRKVLPAVHERLPEARLVLAGSGPPRSLQDLARSHPHVTVTGAVPDMAPHFAAATVVPVPVTTGGGTRFKVLEAFAAGVPVVSTTKGIEGIAARAGHEYLPAETATEFADAIIRLWDERGLAERIVENAHRLVEAQYSRPAIARRIAAAISELSLSSARGA